MPLTQQQYEKSLDDPAVCEQLPVRDYLDNVMVRTNGSLVAGYALKGVTSYFASDDDRTRGKVMKVSEVRFPVEVRVIIEGKTQQLWIVLDGDGLTIMYPEDY